ncbi:hypothetical protein LshimejAT787_2500350 [Lyophyllum shimeji]|uniref:DUF6589 domain-containing protein n=1 Tax=Lyophyllum shimeji TaxID=47721 RepID=A0A9P3Q0Z7_LYOSH|nr:hypothetical protein LshimejAT787_2500350 [Lyophyllum shimeji]
MDIAQKAYLRIQTHTEYRVLWFLLDCPEFDLVTYTGRDSDALKPLPPVNQLPCGPDHATLQYLLGTVNIPEASYEDHERLIDEWFNQLGWKNAGQQMKLATTKVVPWVGDQLTMDCLRGLFKFRADDENSYKRLDFMVLAFGWLHLQMAFANSLHKQYLGTSEGRGLRQAFELLKRKGLTRVLTQGPFHHDLEEALYHVAERTPEELAKLAAELVRHHASSEAMDDMDADTENPVDEHKRQVIMWNRDVLQYIMLNQAVRHGDVGLMEDFLPVLLFRFIVGGNGNYTNEILELLQNLHREWPAEVCDFVRQHCWVINFSGKPGEWCEVDKAQEHNIKDMKVTYRSEGPNIQWEFLKKLHPAIHVIRGVTDYIEKQFGTLTRGKKHTIPKKEEDVQTLHKSYHTSGHHKRSATISKIRLKKDRAEDFASDGFKKFQSGSVLGKWVHQRTFTRSKAERWEDNQGSEDEVVTTVEDEGSEEAVEVPPGSERSGDS